MFKLSYRKYKVDEFFFTDINSEEKAYWLGFISADGNICKKENGTLKGFTINLKAGDINHLSKLKTSINSGHPISQYKVKVKGKEYKVAHIFIGSKRIAQDLFSLGVTPSKSLIIKPALINSKLERHYWRGVIDGDGSLFITKGKSSINLTGSQGMVTGFKRFLRDHGILDNSQVLPHGNIWRWKTADQKISRQVASLLWDNCKIFLDRKYITCSHILEL